MVSGESRKNSGADHSQGLRADRIGRVDVPTSPNGRGIALVNVCADEWGVEPLDVGKAVWFTLTLLPKTS